jgi:hypothetical protein
MKRIINFLTGKSANLTTEFARRRLEKAMPGEVGSMASQRLTGVSL